MFDELRAGSPAAQTFDAESAAARAKIGNRSAGKPLFNGLRKRLAHAVLVGLKRALLSESVIMRPA